MKRIVILISSLCLASASLFAQTIPDMTEDEKAKYVITMSGIDFGKANFSDSVFTKIGDISLHIKATLVNCDYWYQKYGLDYLAKHYGKDLSNDEMFEDIKPYSFTNYINAQSQYSRFIEKRIKGIPQYAKYKSNVNSLLLKVSDAGSVEKLFMLSSFNTPVYFTSYKKTLTPYLEVISTNLLNIRKSQKERILIVLQEEIVPMLSCFNGTFDSSIKYYGISYTYVSDNLSGDKLEAQGETISIIAPAKSVSDYRNLSITQEELLKTCELFYVNTVNKEVRKISFDSLLL